MESFCMAEHISGRFPCPISVLMVDDDQDLRETIRIIVEDTGYPVLEGRDGVEAPKMLQAQPVPVIVPTNHHVPRLDGPGLLGRALDESALLSGHAYLDMTGGTRSLPPDLQQVLTRLHAPLLFKPSSADAVQGTIAAAAHRLHSETPRNRTMRGR
jgi:CheY-like chemotaxis protein